ncbi:MAG TPA: Mpo1-like protein, partial [bacterium]|nr:Mpo1-like protein [bacterium]
WKVALILFVVGWIFQFVGHAVEGKPPAFFSNPAYLLIGPIWLLKKLKKGWREAPK